MRILFLAWRDLQHPLAGGSEVLVDRLARGLVERGHEVELLCARPAGSRAYPVTSTGGTYSHYAGVPLSYLRRHRGTDLVVDVANGVPYFSPLWRRGPSLCLVNHLHTEHWPLWFSPPVAFVGRKVEDRLMPAVYRRTLFVAVSTSTAAALAARGVRPDHIRIVHNGVDPDDVPPVKSPTPLFLAMGRLVPNKRFDALLRMWEAVRPVTGGRLVVLGDGPDAARLRSLAGPDAFLPGWVPEEEKQHLLRSAWVLLHPSAVEGWGLGIMEAAVRETPAVGFDVPGVRDSVVHGQTGELARSEEEFARAWARLGTEPSPRQALGRQARQRAASFSWSSTLDAFAHVAEEALTWSPTRAPAPCP